MNRYLVQMGINGRSSCRLLYGVSKEQAKSLAEKLLGKNGIVLDVVPLNDPNPRAVQEP